MVRARIGKEEVLAALRIAAHAGPHTPRADIAAAVRATARYVAQQHPGKAVEVRIPPYVAVQGWGGVRHTRGTPPNVVETDARTWLRLLTGVETWQRAVETGAVHASGARSDISAIFPLQVE